MTLMSSDLQSDSDLDSIRNSCDVSSATTKIHIFFSVQIQGGKVIRRSGPAASYARLREKLWRLRTPFSLQYNCTVQQMENTETNTNPECVEKA